MSAGSSPFDGRQLSAYMTSKGFDLAVDKGKNMQLATRGGRKVHIPLSTGKRMASWSQIKACAAALGMTHQEVAAELGADQSTRKAGTKKKAPVKQGGVTGSDARRKAEALRHKVNAIEGWLAHGTHGSALYGRVYAALHSALQAIDEWPPHGDRKEQQATYERLSPDDSRYRPAPSDSLLNGAGRVTGDTARAVRRGRTFTHHQLGGGS